MSTLSWHDHKYGKIGMWYQPKPETNYGHMTAVAQLHENLDAHSENGVGLRCTLLP